MGKVVDHVKRRKEILRKTIDLFSSEGYQNVTYQMISSRCGLQRTTLYKYFPTKHDIFEGAIKSVTDEIGLRISQILSNQADMNYSDRLLMLVNGILDLMDRHISLLQCINEYLLGLQRQGEDVARRVRTYTITVRRALINLIRDGMTAGEFSPGDSVLAGDTLYGIMEAAALRSCLFNTASLIHMKQSCKFIVESLKKENHTTKYGL